jgi:hypothetical protein
VIQENKKETEMTKRLLVSSPWWQVGLTVVPGLIFLFSALPSSWQWGRFMMLAVLILWIISGVVLAVQRRSVFQIPIWCLVPLGWLAGIGSLFIFQVLGLYPTCILIALIGLVFARQHGLSAVLFVLAGGMLVASFAIEPGMYLLDSPYRRIILDNGMSVLFWVLLPLWLLRSRTVFGQGVGLLFAMAAYASAFLYALSKDSGYTQPMFQFSVGQSISVAGPFIGLFFICVLGAAVYAWIYSPDDGQVMA